MKIVISNKFSAYYNLSLEEVILRDKEIKEDVLFIYQNDNFIVFGRNQNVHEEINSSFVKEKQIGLMRRISGGGAVYQDKGNVNFSFITDNKSMSYQGFLNPIIDFLKSLGLDAKFKGKNDLTVNGYKVSGNAQYKYKDRMFHHGTLLLDADLQMIGNSLKPNKLKLESKSIKSARQRVANINDLLKEKLTSEDFINKLVEFLTKNKEADIMDISNYKIDELEELQKIRKSEDWIFGKNPSFKILNEKRFEGGTIKFEANVVDNKIKNIRFTGDFLSLNDFENIYKYFIGKNYEEKDIKELLEGINDLSDYFGKLTIQNILELMF